jgi:two-component system, OmpR family, KDP operon response regulator KdpE
MGLTETRSSRCPRSSLGFPSARGASSTEPQHAAAEEALTRAALRVPDAAIIEMTLPDGTGTQICRALRQWSSVPVILLSGVSDEIWLLEAFDAGADDYVTNHSGA